LAPAPADIDRRRAAAPLCGDHGLAADLALQDDIGNRSLADPELVRPSTDLPSTADQEPAEKVLPPPLRRLDLGQQLTVTVAEDLGCGRLDPGVGRVPQLARHDTERLVGAPRPLARIGHAD